MNTQEYIRLINNQKENLIKINMKDKINLVELLRNCPVGMKLDCTMYEDVYFDYIDEFNMIHCYIQREKCKTSVIFNQYGTPSYDTKSKCVIFPKGKTTWEGFQRPFKDGDICYIKTTCEHIFIFKNIDNYHCINRYVNLSVNRLYTDNAAICGIGFVKEFRLATEKEKETLFQAIKDNGYKWNAETKTLEKLVEPKFKVGDRIVHKVNKTSPFTITEVTEQSYKGGTQYEVLIEQQDNFELDYSIKFDINTMKVLQPVLVRNTNGQVWTYLVIK